MDDGFIDVRAEMDARFDKVDKRFDKVDDRIGKVDELIDGLRSDMDGQFRRVDGRLVEIDLRIHQQETHFVALRGELVNLASVLRTEVHRELRLHLLALVSLSLSIAGLMAATSG